MKAKVFTKAIAMILSFAIVISLLPLSVFADESNSNVEYVEGGNAEKGRYESLGRGFNALSSTEIKDHTLISGAGTVIDYDAVKATVLSTSDTEHEIIYAKTVEELMLSFGINYSDQNSVNVPIKNVKFGLTQKFGFSANVDYGKIEESFYYYYREDTVTGKYSLLLPESLMDDPAQIISDEFIYSLEKLNSDYSNEKCAEFFQRWGTHILISYKKGAALEYVAEGHSTDTKFEGNVDISNKLSVSAGKGDISAEKTQEISVDVGLAYNSSKYQFSHKWYSMGGKSQYISASGDDASKIDQNSITKWKDSISSEASVMLPQTTEWIAIWELIPDSYAGLKNALQKYYQNASKGLNAEFFDKFTNYSEVKGDNMIVYTSPSGYVSLVQYHNDEIPLVAPNSKFNVVDLNADLSKITFEYDPNQCTVDEYGMVTVKATSGKITIRVKKLDGGEIEGAAKTFTVQAEGDGGRYAGGYGTKDRPYLVSTTTHFDNIRYNTDKYFMLIDNIGLTESISPIGSFSGVLDGNGFYLAAWKYTQTSNGNIGLFAVNRGTIKNLDIAGFQISNNNPNVAGTLCVGLLCGMNYGTLENIHASLCKISVDLGDVGKNEDALIAAGILCGTLEGENAKISKCTVVTSTIQAIAYTQYQRAWCAVGGLVGYANGGTITDVSSHNDSRDFIVTAGATYSTFLGACNNKNHGHVNGYAGGVVGVAENGTKITRALGYDNYIHVDLDRDCKHGVGRDSACGSVVGKAYDITWTNCYSETDDGRLIGSDDNSNNSNYKLNLTAAGVLTSDDRLAGFREGWCQNEGGGHLDVRNNFSGLEISGGDREYFVGEPLNLEGLVISNAPGTVDKGEITGGFKVSGYNPQMTGTQTITLIYCNRNVVAYMGTYQVTVMQPEVESISISSMPYKTSYVKPDEKTNFLGEKLDFNGLTVIAKYTDGKMVEIPFEQLTLPDISVVTESQNIVISYMGHTASYKVQAFDVCISKITVVENSYKKNYALGDAFDPTGLQVELTYSNDRTEILGLDVLTLDTTAFDKDTPNTYSITVRYQDLTTSFDVVVGSVKNIRVVSLPNKTEYYSSEAKIVTDGLEIEVTYDNGATKVVSSGFTVSGYDNTDLGKQEILVSYFGATTTFEINLIAVEMVSIEISEYPRTTYYAGNTFSTSGLVLKVNYNDGSCKEISSGFTVKLDGYDINTEPALNVLGTKTVFVAYTEDGIRLTKEYTIEIIKDWITELQVIQDPNKTTYNLWDDFSYSGMIVYAVYASGKAEVIELAKSMFSVQMFTLTGEQSVVLNYEGRSAEIVCRVNAPASIAVTKLPAQTVYEVGDTISLDGMEVTAYFADGSQKLMDMALIQVSYPSTDTTGNKSVNLRIDSYETAFEITVNEKTIDENAPRIVVSEVKGAAGTTVTVTVAVKNNPGIASMKLKVNYADALELTNIAYNDEIGGQFTLPQTMKSPVILNWVNAMEDSHGDWIFATLTFEIAENAEAGVYPITVTYDPDDLYDLTETNIDFAVQNGFVEVIEYIPGDVNGDGKVNNKDATRLLQYLSGWNVEVVEVALDINNDGKINNKDATRLLQYLSGWDVEIH